MARQVRRRPARRPRRRLQRRKPLGRAVVKRKSDYARLVEAQQLPVITNAQGLATSVDTFSLGSYQRAMEVAHAYKYYRCAKVEVHFVPYATQSFTGGGAAAKMPQLYWTIDRVGNMWGPPDEAEMNERGLTPKLFKKNMKFSYKPNLLQHVQMETNQPADGGGNPLGINVINAVNSIPIFNKWLPTQQSAGFKPGITPLNQVGQQVTQAAGNPYALKYYGDVWLVTVDNPATTVVGEVFYKVTWEFKSPRAIKGVAPAIEPYILAGTSIMNPATVPNTQPTNYP